MFSRNRDTGAVRIYAELDFEENNASEIQVNALGKGNSSIVGQGMVLEEVLDIMIMSLR